VRGTLGRLLTDIRRCNACVAHLPLGPRPILQAATRTRILIVGQAPSVRVHLTGVPWNDASGDRLREWLAISREDFHDASRVAIVPMGFCYPGRGKSGDLPPRRECADLWLDQLLARLPHIELTLLIGQYAQRHFLGRLRKPSLTETVRAWREYGPRYLPLPHPSPRNQAWLMHNPWFARTLIPELRERIARLTGPQ